MQGQHSALMEALGSLMEPGQAAQAERALGTLGLLLQKPALCAAACSSLLPEAVSGLMRCPTCAHAKEAACGTAWLSRCMHDHACLSSSMCYIVADWVL